MIRVPGRALAAVALVMVVATTPAGASEGEVDWVPLLEAAGLDVEDVPAGVIDQLDVVVEDLIDRDIIEREEVDRIGDLAPAERSTQALDRAAHSHGVAHSLARFLTEQGVEVSGPGGLRAAMHDYLANEGVLDGLDDADRRQLRQLFVEHLEEEGIDVEGGRLGEALSEAGYGPTDEERADRAAEREERRQLREERDEARDEERARRQEERRDRVRHGTDDHPDDEFDDDEFDDDELSDDEVDTDEADDVDEFDDDELDADEADDDDEFDADESDNGDGASSVDEDEGR